MGKFSAYSDEAYIADRFQSVSVVTFESESESSLVAELTDSLKESNITEFKWSKLRQARDRFAAIKLVDFVVYHAISDDIRVDTLIWDTEDARHNIQGRDDTENLQRMYYHLFRNVLQERWPVDSTWDLFPDENSALDWPRFEEFLDRVAIGVELKGDLFDPTDFRVVLLREFHIENVQEVSSREVPFSQIADLFAGMGAFSHTYFATYKKWCQEDSGQLSLLNNHSSSVSDSDLSPGEAEKCLVLSHLNKLCKKNKLWVGLESSRGLKTYNPKYPINFWLYQPQHPDDKAPIKGMNVS